MKKLTFEEAEKLNDVIRQVPLESFLGCFHEDAKTEDFIRWDQGSDMVFIIQRGETKSLASAKTALLYKAVRKLTADEYKLVVKVMSDIETKWSSHKIVCLRSVINNIII